MQFNTAIAAIMEWVNHLYNFNEWKEMTLNPKDIVNEDGSLEKWSGNIEGQKKFVKNMDKEFDNMKKEFLSKFK